MNTRTSDRGQAFTLEAIVAGVLLLTSLVFALQVTAVTPLSSSTSSQHIENQQQAVAEGVLATSSDAGDLKRMVLFWNDTEGQFWCGDAGDYYTSRRPDTGFGERIEEAFGGRGVAYNVYITYETDTGETRDRVIYRGEPSDNAVSATRQVTLYDSDTLTQPVDTDDDGDRCDDADEGFASRTASTTTTISSNTFYADDTSTSSDVYNIVRVEVVAWRM
jgi:hypothetical protein